jgi:hypothetical protein
MVFYLKKCWQKILSLKRNSFKKKHKKVYSIFTLKIDGKISSLKKDSFSQKHKKVVQFVLKFHFETMVLSIGFLLSWIQNLKKMK